MLIDKRLSSFDRRALTGSANGDEIDLGVDNVRIGAGEPLVWETHLEAADAANNNETYAFDLKEASNAAFSADVATIATHTLNRNRSDTPMFTYLPASRKFRRYLRVEARLGGTTPSCTVTSTLSSQRPSVYDTYPDAITITADS